MSLQVQSGSVGFEFNSGLPLWRRTKSLYVVSYCSIPSVDHWGFTALWSRYLNGWFEHQGYFATPQHSITCCGCGCEIKMVKMKGSTGSKSGQKIYCILLRQLHWADFQARCAHAAHRAAKVGHYLPWSTSPCHFCRCCSQGSENPRAPWSSPCTQTAHTAPTDHEVLLQADFLSRLTEQGQYSHVFTSFAIRSVRLLCRMQVRPCRGALSEPPWTTFGFSIRTQPGALVQSILGVAPSRLFCSWALKFSGARIRWPCLVCLYFEQNQWHAVCNLLPQVTNW